MRYTIDKQTDKLLELIKKTETGRTGIAAYRTIYGHREDTLPVQITDMTVGHLLKAQAAWGKKWGSSAAGAYQFIRKTLAGLVKELNIDPSEKFTPALQDQLGYHLLVRRGLLRFRGGKMSAKEFGNNLAKEWASFPVLNDMQGASRLLKRGQSYYAGDGLNKSLIAPEVVERLLGTAQPDMTVPKEVEDVVEKIDKPMSESKTVWSAILAALLVVLEGFTDLPQAVQLALIAVGVGLSGFIIYERWSHAKRGAKAKEKLSWFNELEL